MSHDTLPPTKRQRRDEPRSAIASTAPAPLAADADVDDKDLVFKLTRVRGAPDAHNKYAIGLPELLDGAFTTVLLTNYKYDLPWLFATCPRLRDVPVVLVHGERDKVAIASECHNFTNVTLVAPPLPIPYGTHHTKMMVVVYPTKVRVVICTANFIPGDWDNKTQGVWSQDFGLKTLSDDEDDDNNNNSKPLPVAIDFEADLTNYLRHLGTNVASFCRNELARFDYSTATVALVPSVPGVHKGAAMHKYGHLRVRKLLQLLRIQATDNPLICQFSSLGSLDEKWLFGEFAKSLLIGRRDVTSTSAPIQALHVVWPSVDDIRNSNEGWDSGRSVPCPLKNMKPFLHKYLRKWSPPSGLYRQRAMPHIKTYARFAPTTSANSGALDWAILTSANLSKAAWGALQRSDTQCMIRSYELGVLFVPQLLQQGGGDSKVHRTLAVVGSSAASAATTGTVAASAAIANASLQRPLLLPLPYSFPLTTYDPQVDEPWVWDVVRDAPDVFGNCYLL